MKELRGSASAAVTASAERCFELLAAVDAYPSWYPAVVRSVEVIELGDNGRPVRARATLHVAYGPLVKDFRLVLAIDSEQPRSVGLYRLPNEASDVERFEVRWRVAGRGPGRGDTHIDVELDASLDVPRFIPLGGIGAELAGGFVRAAARTLGGP